MSRESMLKTYDKDVERYDYFISPNRFSTEKFETAFKISKEKLIESGYPRNDFISNITEQEIDNLKEKYNITKDKKVFYMHQLGGIIRFLIKDTYLNYKLILNYGKIN